jgi:hypothetical protein
MTDLKRLLLKCGSVVDSNLHQAMILENIMIHEMVEVQEEKIFHGLQLGN